MAHESHLAATLNHLAFVLLDEDNPIDEQFNPVHEATRTYASTNAALAAAGGPAAGGGPAAAAGPAATAAAGPLAADSYQAYLWPPPLPDEEEPIDFMEEPAPSSPLAPKWACLHTRETLEMLKEVGSQGDDTAAAQRGCRNSGMTLEWLGKLAVTASNRKMLEQELAALIRLPAAEQHVEKGAALLEAWMTGTDYTAVVDVVAEEVAHVADAVEALYPSPSPSIRTKLEALSKIMRASGFKGNVADYYNPKNSYLSHVVTTKLGIPISLAVVVIAVGRKIGLTLDPINFPRHFLLKCKLETGQELILDTFEGRLLSREENAAVHGLHDEKYYVSTTNVELLLRMCRNLVAMEPSNITEGSRLAALDLMVAIQPDALGSIRSRITRALLLLNDMRSHYASAGNEFGFLLRSLGEGPLTDIFPHIHEAVSRSPWDSVFLLLLLPSLLPFSSVRTLKASLDIIFQRMDRFLRRPAATAADTCAQFQRRRYY